MSDSNICVACCGCIFLIAFFGSFIAFPVTSIYLGFTYIDDCPVQPWIPIFLIVLGIVSIVIELINFVIICCNKGDQQGSSPKVASFGALLNLFFLGWVITGTVWYKNANPVRNGNPYSDDYCQYTLYTYFESQVILAYIFIFLVILVACCNALASSGDDQDTEQTVAVRSIQGTQVFATVFQRVEMMYYVET